MSEPLSGAGLLTQPPFLYCFPQLDYERLTRLFAEIGLWRAHVERGLSETEQFPVAHAAQPHSESFHVQVVFAGKVVHNVMRVLAFGVHGLHELELNGQRARGLRCGVDRCWEPHSWCGGSDRDGGLRVKTAGKELQRG